MTERPGVRLRREPPAFRRAAVEAVRARTPHLRTVRLAGEELVGFGIEQPAASVRLLLPSRGGDLVIPTWEGNEFLLPDGSRPVIRTLTPLRADPAAGALDLEIVLHEQGPLSTWAATATPGDPVAISGPGRGYAVDEGAPAFVLAGDLSALPAIGQLLEALPATTPVQVIVELTDEADRVDLPPHPLARVQWCTRSPDGSPGSALLPVLVEGELDPGAQVWVAGEAAAVQRVRRHLFEERGLPRSQAVVRGYWKHGRASGAGLEDDQS